MSLQQSMPAASHAVRVRSTERPGFQSFKTTGPIQYPQRWHRDLLIQATLDPTISAIEPVAVQEGCADSFCVHLTFGDRRRLVVAVRTDDTSEMPTILAPDCLQIPRSFVLREPRCSVSREIWATRNAAIPAGDRIQILHALSEHPKGIALIRLMANVQPRSNDLVEIVLALVCVGQAEVETTALLSPESVVRPGPRLRAAKST